MLLVPIMSQVNDYNLYTIITYILYNFLSFLKGDGRGGWCSQARRGETPLTIS